MGIAVLSSVSCIDKEGSIKGKKLLGFMFEENQSKINEPKSRI